jgi:hypothetical protein
MTDEQINEIMALVEQYGSECWNDGALKYEFESDDTTQEARAAIESALRAVPAIPEPLDCLHINRGSADAEADEYAAEYFAQLAQDKADADLRRGALQTIGYYVRDALRRYQASPQAPDHTEHILGMVQAPQPATPRKPLFEDLIAQHQGLREELSAMDAQPSDWTEQTR